MLYLTVKDASEVFYIDIETLGGLGFDFYNG
jgi:hypothetical protein